MSIVSPIIVVSSVQAKLLPRVAHHYRAGLADAERLQPRWPSQAWQPSRRAGSDAVFNRAIGVEVRGDQLGPVTIIRTAASTCSRLNVRPSPTTT